MGQSLADMLWRSWRVFFFHRSDLDKRPLPIKGYSYLFPLFIWPRLKMPEPVPWLNQPVLRTVLVLSSIHTHESSCWCWCAQCRHFQCSHHRYKLIWHQDTQCQKEVCRLSATEGEGKKVAQCLLCEVIIGANFCSSALRLWNVGALGEDFYFLTGREICIYPGPWSGDFYSHFLSQHQSKRMGPLSVLWALGDMKDHQGMREVWLTRWRSLQLLIGIKKCLTFLKDAAAVYLFRTQK